MKAAIEAWVKNAPDDLTASPLGDYESSRALGALAATRAFDTRWSSAIPPA